MNINLYVNLRSVCVTQLLVIYFAFTFNRIDYCMRKQIALKTFHFTVEIDVVVYYLKQVFHLLCDKGITLAEALLYLSLI